MCAPTAAAIFTTNDLTREHIIPFAQNGVDTWMNVVTACKPCNHRKSHRTPEQAHMPLLYAPYVPSLWEDFILRNRRILADQMEFLMAHVPKSSRLLDLTVYLDSMTRPRIALIAHDHKKDSMVLLAREFAPFLPAAICCATGTTGSRLIAEVGLTVERMLSGPLGGDLQIGARLSVGQDGRGDLLARPHDAPAARARYQCIGAGLRRARRALRHQLDDGTLVLGQMARQASTV